MNRLMVIFVLVLIPAVRGLGAPLRELQSIPLQVEGRIDHFSFDLKTHRLFVCALENNTCEVIDADAGKVIHSIKDLRHPQGVRHLPRPNRLVIANAIDGSVVVYDASSFQPLHRVDLKEDADNVRHDADPDRAWVGHGADDGALALIDTSAGKVLKEIPVGGHPESFQFERHGNRVFVNVPTAQQIVVADAQTGKVIDRWKPAYRRNFAMALDDDHHRLLIPCREPAHLLVLDTANGKQVADVVCVGDCDDIWFDHQAHRVYVTGGEGYVSVIEQKDADHYQTIGNVPTAAGARTSMFVAAWHRLFVAVPHRGQQKSEVRVFDTSAPADRATGAR